MIKSCSTMTKKDVKIGVEVVVIKDVTEQGPFEGQIGTIEKYPLNPFFGDGENNYDWCLIRTSREMVEEAPLNSLVPISKL